MMTSNNMQRTIPSTIAACLIDTFVSSTAANPHAAEMADLVAPMADVAWDYARKAGA